jgi:hypothetical protein
VEYSNTETRRRHSLRWRQDNEQRWGTWLDYDYDLVLGASAEVYTASSLITCTGSTDRWPMIVMDYTGGPITSVILPPGLAAWE